MSARQTHKIFAFKPTVADLRGLTVTAPWKNQNRLLPLPRPNILEAHYFRSIAACMQGAAEFDEDDEDEDDELFDLTNRSP